ncbi:MAG: apolipoprotein N-acyltransferase [Pirellulales bacterium]|nr:apolipoprotein N-acyltransferase [Pirellulales bacterium]
MTFPRCFKSPTFLYAAGGAVLLWAALPPMDLWPLAWIAPVPWVVLIRRKELAGPKAYLALWMIGFSFWLAALHWLRLPHPATSIGWIALAAYFAFYVPAFIALSRSAVHRLRLPVILAAPVVWTGLELARAHLLTGMSMGDIAHTQYRWIALIQIADLAGEHGVTFAIVFVAACLARMLPCENSPLSPPSSSLPSPLSPLPFSIWPLAPAIMLLAVVLSYGYWRIANTASSPGPRIALIQGSIDAVFGSEDRKVRDKFYAQYFALSQDAVKKAAKNGEKLDLIVWPEIFFKERLIALDADAGDNYPEVIQGKISGEKARENIRLWAAHNMLAFAETTNKLGTPILVGLDTENYTASGVQYFNSAAYVSKAGELLGRYDKIHLVMFGEYIPFADLFPWIYEKGLTPLSGGMTPGKEPVAFDLKYRLRRSALDERTVRIAANICYESVLSHVIRKQVNVLREKNQEPDMLINLSNDGWFRGSSELDMHFVCGAFRAVECRKPFLIAANTGFSASIDANGRVLQKGPRHETETLLAKVDLDSRRSFYLQYGDWPAGLCFAGCIFFAIAGIWQRDRRRIRNAREKTS